MQFPRWKRWLKFHAAWEEEQPLWSKFDEVALAAVLPSTQRPAPRHRRYHHHHAAAHALLHFLQVDNWCGIWAILCVCVFFSFLYCQDLMNTSLGSRWKTIAETCGLPSSGRKTLTAGCSAPQKERIPAGNAQVQMFWRGQIRNRPLVRQSMMHIAHSQSVRLSWTWPFRHIMSRRRTVGVLISVPPLHSAARQSNTRCFRPAGAGQAEFIIRIKNEACASVVVQLQTICSPG